MSSNVCLLSEPASIASTEPNQQMFSYYNALPLELLAAFIMWA